MTGMLELPSFTTAKGTERLVPSGNHRNQYFVRAGRVAVSPTKSYEEWRKTAEKSVREAGIGSYKTGCMIYIWIWGGIGFYEHSDWDNVQKVVGDVLVAAGVVPDDSVTYIRAWRPWYITREEHSERTGEDIKKLRARMFFQIVPIEEAGEPFRK